MTVGDRIKMARNHRKITRRQLSEKSGVPYQTLSSLESGDQRSSTAIASIATALSIHPLWLSTGSGLSGLPDISDPATPIPATFADRMREARIAAGLNQAQLARLCGISAPSIHDLESGKSKATRPAALMHMSRALGRSPDWLVFGETHAAATSLAELPESGFEKSFLEDFRKLSSVERKIVVRRVRSLTIDK